MSDELEKIRKEKMKLIQNVTDEVMEQTDLMPEKASNLPDIKQKKKDVQQIVSDELSKVNEKDLYELSLSELEKNPNLTTDDLVYSMAKSLNKSTKSKFLKKITKTIMKQTSEVSE